MLFQNKSTDPCSLTQQVEDLRKIIRQTNWHTHNVRLSLHCKDGDPTRFLFRDLYTVYAIGEDTIFIEAGFDWREPGCSMCLAMNPDQLKPKERCVSTSNRNFEGRQGREGRTHLVSPSTAAVSAINGKISLVKNFINE